MIHAYSTGFFLGLSLIIAIGAQNAFVLRQGIIRQHIFYIALFCSISDSILIALGVVGISYFVSDFIYEYSKLLFGLASIWLMIYGVIRLSSALKSNSAINLKNIQKSSLFEAISIITILTFANPHVYLDTMILIGSISQQFYDINRLYFTIGACSASFFWFFAIAYSAKLITPIMQNPFHWKILDFLIALVMFIIALNLATQGGWF